MAFKLSILIVGLVVYFTSSVQIAIAEDLEVAFRSTLKPTITRAVDIVQRPADRIEFGTQLIFKQQPTQRAERIRRKGFQIRVFTLGVNETIPNPVTSIDDCNIYVSVVYVVHSGNSSDIVFKRMDESWLGISHSGRTVFNGHHLFVFEAVETGGGTRETVFRLHKDDAKSYFDTGFRLTVDGAGRASIEEVRAAFTPPEGELVDLYKEIDERGNEIPCYRYLKYADDAAQQQYAQGTLEMCGANIAGQS